MAVATSAAATLTFIPLSNAADGTGVYAAWTVADSKTEATGAFTGTTPFGEQYGTSRGQTYLTSAITAGKSQGTVTLNFEAAPNPLTWSFAVGDVDAENISLSALDLD